MNTLEIKEKLKNYGGVVFTGRQQGKTTAILELASQNNADIIVWHYHLKKEFLRIIKTDNNITNYKYDVRNNNFYNPDYSGKIWTESEIVERPSILNDRKFYCDEVSFRMLGVIEDNPMLNEGFLGATRGGISFPISFVKPKYNDIATLLKSISPKQLLAEFMFNML
jgi:hypothetical protein